MRLSLRPGSLRRPPPLAAVGLVLLAAEVSVAGSNVLAKDYADSVHPFAYELIRRLGATGAIAVVALLSGAPLRPGRDDLGSAVLPGLLGQGMGRLSLMGAISLAPVGLAVMVDAATPVVAMLLAVAVGLERVAARRGIGMALALLGVALLVLGGPSSGGGSAGGLLLALGAPLGWGIAYVAAARATVGSILRQLVILNLTGSAVMAAFVLLGGRIDETIGALALIPLPAWLLSVAAASLENGVILWGARRIGLSRAIAFEYAQPVVTAALAASLLNEVPTLAALLAGAMVIGGVALTQAPEPRQPPAQPESALV